MAINLSASFQDSDWVSKTLDHLLDHGIAVITDVFTPEECHAHMGGLLDSFEALGTGIDRKDFSTWKADVLPPQTRPGMFQALVGNLPTVWELRTDSRIREIFTQVYSNFRGEEIQDYIVSSDGLSLKPPTAPYHSDGAKDWPHLDQSESLDTFRCFQGQVVLTNTTASFRASPGSHRVFDQILQEKAKGNWYKIPDERLEEVQELVESSGGEWQRAISAPKGSVILWTSSTVHSAQPLRKGPLDASDPYNGWRGVVYVCYRPKREFSKAEINRRKKAYEENRLTNHWSTKTFPKVPGGRWAKKPSNPTMAGMVDDPTRLNGNPKTATPKRDSITELIDEKIRARPLVEISWVELDLERAKRKAPPKADLDYGEEIEDAKLKPKPKPQLDYELEIA
jgi:hypothetical protein